MKTPNHLEVFALQNAAPIACRVSVAKTWHARLRGLLGKRSIASDEGLLITPCNSVHSFGLGFAIDVIFLDTCNVVTKCTTLAPGSCAFGPRRAQSVLELQAGRVAQFRITVGDRLLFATAAHRPTTHKERSHD